MNWPLFSTTVSGKWVLAGEHSVLRGGVAVALPHPEMKLKFSFEPRESSEGGIQIHPQIAQSPILDLLTAIQDAREADGYSFKIPQGEIKVESRIPMGAGLGSSAALCVAMTRWMAEPLQIAHDRWIEFATQLEHRFHGRSSGMDVAVISLGEPITYEMERGLRRIGVRKLPLFTFHDTGLRARTSECVLKVEKFREETPVLACQIDESMAASSRQALEGLVRYDAGHREEGISILQKAMLQARECFYHWGLVPTQAKALEEELLGRGALAVKMTGAGGGGMVVALWSGDSNLNAH